MTLVEKPPVLDDDAVTSCRRELKFAFHAGDISRLRDLLELRCQTIRFGKSAESLVNSIYFDDAPLSSCVESLGGSPERTKVRLRWYDEPLATGTSFFEIKRRTGTMIRKWRTPVRLSQPLVNLPYSRIVPELLESLVPNEAAVLALRDKPTVIVSYKRRHFRDTLTGTRLTLDYDIKGYDQTGRTNPALRFPVQVPDLVVLEAKAAAGDETAVSRLIPGVQARLTRSSKYLACCARMGWCALPDRHE